MSLTPTDTGAASPRRWLPMVMYTWLQLFCLGGGQHEIPKCSFHFVSVFPGVFANDMSDDEDDRPSFGGGGRRSAKNYTAPVGFVSGGIKVGDKVTKTGDDGDEAGDGQMSVSTCLCAHTHWWLIVSFLSTWQVMISENVDSLSDTVCFTGFRWRVWQTKVPYGLWWAAWQGW